MSKVTVIRVLSGDIRTGAAKYLRGKFLLDTPAHRFTYTEFPASQVVELQPLSTEMINDLGGMVGGALLGAIGGGWGSAGAGAALFGLKNQVTFVAGFSNGARIVATTDPKTYRQMYVDAY